MIRYLFLVPQATGEIEKHFTSDLMEPRLVVFHQEDEIIQMFLCAENDSLLEIPVNTLAEGFTHLMAAYYVFDVSYPRGCMPSLLSPRHTARSARQSIQASEIHSICEKCRLVTKTFIIVVILNYSNVYMHDVYI